MNRPHLPPNERTAPSVIRGLIADAIVLRERSPKNAARLAAGNARLVDAVERAAVTFTATQSAFNAPRYVDDVALFIGPSGFRAIAAKAVLANFDDEASSVVITNTVVSPTQFSFVAQGAPIRVRQSSYSSTSVTPRKVGVIQVLTRQLLESSNAGPLTRRALEEGLPGAADYIMLDTAADDTIRPAGIRNGISAETSGGANAMVADLTLLASKVAGIAGNLENIIFIADPTTAAKIKIALPLFGFQVVASAGLAAGTVMAVAANAIAIGAGSEIRYETSATAAIHMEDAAPADVGTVGTPNAIAAPVRSMLQTDCIAAKLIFNLDWKVRVANSVAWMGSIAW